MARFNFLVISFFLALSTFFFSGGEVTTTVHNTFPQQTVQASTAYSSQGVIVDSQLEIIVNLQLDDSNPFFKQLGLINAVYREQQENFLAYQKTSKCITVGLSTRQIIYPFHWFT